LTILASTLAWLVVALGCMCVGSSGDIAWPSAGNFFIRRELVGIASLVGAALASAGVVYQAILCNPLADPYLLGVSSGATLFSYLWRLPFLTAILHVFGAGGQAMSQQAFVFVGAIGAMMIVFALASRGGRIDPITLLLVGVIVNSVSSSIFLLLNSIQRGLAGAGGELTFIIGRIQTSLTQDQIIAATVVIGIGWLALLYISGELNVAGLSESEAESLGVRIHRLRWIGLIVASLVTASAVAISGPIGFIGLVCPHLARLMVGNDQRKLLPVATAMGASLLAIADAASRLLAHGEMVRTLLPVGVLTGLIGGPFFLFLLWQNQRRAAAGRGET
jgi:iron complex transport system permease protein